MGRKAKIIGILATLAVVGGVAMAATAEGEIESGGMLLGEDCSSVTIVDPEVFIDAFVSFARGVDEALELDQPDDIEELFVVFLAEHFPACSWPPSGGFAWLTPTPGDEAGSQQWLTRGWDELIEQTAAINRSLGGVDDPIVLTAHALAGISRTIGPVPTPDDDERPLPPIPPIDSDGLGAGGGEGDIIQAVDVQDMMDLGVERAMETGGSSSPVPSLVVLVYDPDWPGARDVLQMAIDEAGQHPEVLLVLATMADTQAAFGLPEELGVVGMAINAANAAGHYAQADADGWGFEDAPPTRMELEEYFHFALGPTPRPGEVDESEPQPYSYGYIP